MNKTEMASRKRFTSLHTLALSTSRESKNLIKIMHSSLASANIEACNMSSTSNACKQAVAKTPALSDPRSRTTRLKNDITASQSKQILERGVHIDSKRCFAALMFVNDVETYLQEDFVHASVYMALMSSECWINCAMLEGSVINEAATVFK